MIRGRLTFVLLAFLVVAALPAMAADISGQWTFTVNSDSGSGSPTFTFAQDGEELTGTYSGLAGEAKLTGTVKGNKIAFQFQTEWGTVKYDGTVEGSDKMKGTADYAGQLDATWTAKRSK